MTSTTATDAQAPAPYDGFDSLYVGGVWGAGSDGQYFEDLDPWTGKSITRIARATVKDVEEALQFAKEAQREWAQTPPAVRARIMRTAGDILTARKDEFIAWSAREVGSTTVKASIEWDVARSEMYEAAGMAYHVTGQILPSDVPGKENRVYRTPLGVIAVISPWNFPLNLTTRSVLPAVALGNTVVLKPSEESPVTGGLFLAKVFEEAGLPAGILQVVTHAREDAIAVGDTITTSPIPKFISFTGSTAVGRHISSKAGIKHLALELGGNTPIVVLGDADLDQAVDGAAFSCFMHQGQICMSGQRLIVEASIYDEFVERFVERVRSLPVGDPSDPSTFIGPVINRRQFDGILDKVERARKAGAEQLLGGDPTGPSGLLLPPQILVGDSTTPTAAEEVFGPVVTIIRAEDEADALRIANDTEYGLSSAVFTGSLERGVAFAQQIEAGMTHVNDVSPEGEAHVAFGGEKDSGIGRFGGEWILQEFTTTHWISVQRTPRQYFA